MSEYNIKQIVYKETTAYESLLDVVVYSDDSVMELKYKLSQVLDVKDARQYYFFYKKKTSLNPYNELKKYFNKQYILTQERLNLFLSNYDLTLEIPAQDTYTMDDLVRVNFPLLTTQYEPLGLHIKEKIVSVNPFLHDLKYDVLSDSENTMCLLEYPNMINNEIYVVCVGDLVPYLSEHIKTYSKVFFPDIYKDKNFHLDTSVLPDLSQTVQAIHQQKAYYKDNITFQPIIKSVSCILYPKEKVFIPVDLLFKVMNSTKPYPMVQLRLEREQEQMIRLFTNDEYSNNHMAIPYLPKNLIMNLSKQVKKQTIFIYIHGPNQLTLEMNQQGQIIIHIGYNTEHEIGALEKWIHDQTRDLMDIIVKQFDPGEHIFRNFYSFSSPNVDLLKMNYEYEVRLDKRIQYIHMKKYFNSIFNYNGNDDAIYLKFIRVSNYIESDNIRSRIIHLIRENYDMNFIIKNISEQFPKVDVQQKINEVYEMTDIREATRRKKRSIVSPGIDILIKYKKMEGEKVVYHIEITNITHYKYIDILKLYLSNLFNILNGQPSDGLIETERDVPVENVAVRVRDPKPVGTVVDSDSDDTLSSDTESDSESVSDAVSVKSDESDAIRLDLDAEEPEEAPKPPSSKSSENSFDIMKEYGGAPPNVMENFKNRYPFLTALKARDKELFSQDYSRKCPKQERRQPIVLTNAERKRIEEIFLRETQHKEKVIQKLYKNTPLTDEDKALIRDNLYEKDYEKISKKWDALTPDEKKMIQKNLSDEERVPPESIMEINKNHYMCSLYWDFKKDVPVSETKAKKLESRIFSDTKFTAREPIPGDKYIFKIFRDEFPNKTIVSLLKNGKAPCCYSKAPAAVAPTSHWILDHSKIILEENRVGHLTENLARFFKYDSRKRLNEKNELIEDCLLRKGTGVENSFLVAISKIFGYIDPHQLILQIIEKVNLDTILQFHNGKLPSLFYNEKGVMVEPNQYAPLTEAYITQNYAAYPLYKKMKTHNYQGLARIINGLENFHAQLFKFIDYVYLWDIVTSGLLRLDEPGVPINMILLSDVLDDQTNKIEILCPVSDYSKYEFNTSKYKSCILYCVKKDDRLNYQPIIIKEKHKPLKKQQDAVSETYLFSDSNVIVKQLSKILKQMNMDKCGPRRKTDDFKLNLTLSEIKDLLPKGYIILRQLVNYNGQVVAGLIQHRDENYYLPTRPSGILPTIKYYVMGQAGEELFHSYNETITFLKELKQKQPALLCDVHSKIIKDGQIIGFLTETNQFIELSDSEPDVHDDGLNRVEDDSFLEYDKVISTEKTRQLSNIFRLKLEERFYALFFQKMKIILSDIKLFVKKRALMDIITSNLSLPEKIEQAQANLEEYINTYFEFTNIDEPLVEDLIENLQKEIPYVNSHRDVIEDIDKNKYTNNMCLIETPDHKCILPLYNLYSKEPNLMKYVKIFTENIIRNYRIYKSFFYESYTANPVKSYKLNANEILLFHSNLENYFLHLNDINLYKKYYDISPTKLIDFIEHAQKTRDVYRTQHLENKGSEEGPLRRTTRAVTPRNSMEFLPSNTATTDSTDSTGSFIFKSPTNSISPVEVNLNAPIEPVLGSRLNGPVALGSRLNGPVVLGSRLNGPVEVNLNAPEPTLRPKLSFIQEQNEDSPKEVCNVAPHLQIAEELEYKTIMADNCVKKMYFSDGKWKVYFPKYTLGVRFNTTTNDCNYLLLNIIDKCQRLKQTSKSNIKKRLIYAYKKINIDKVIPFLKKDGKTMREGSLDEANYPLTLTDMVIYCFFYKLPVTFCKLERTSGRTYDVVAYDFQQVTDDYRYYIRVINPQSFELLYYSKGDNGFRLSKNVWKQEPPRRTLQSPIEVSLAQLYV